MTPPSNDNLSAEDFPLDDSVGVGAWFSDDDERERPQSPGPVPASDELPQDDASGSGTKKKKRRFGVLARVAEARRLAAQYGERKNAGEREAEEAMAEPQGGDGAADNEPRDSAREQPKLWRRLTRRQPSAPGQDAGEDDRHRPLITFADHGDDRPVLPLAFDFDDEDEPQPPALGGGDESPPRTVWERVMFAWQASARKNKRPAGTDLSSPSLWERLRSHTRPSAEDNPEAYGIPLEPLSDSEFSELQRALRAEDPLIIKIDRARERALSQQRLGFFVSFVSLIMFALIVGTEYVTDKLVHAQPPLTVTRWIVDAHLDSVLSHNTVTGVLVVLGFLVVLVAAKVAGDAVFFLLRALSDSSLIDAVQAAGALVFAGGMFIALVAVQPLPAALLAVSWFIMRAITSRIERKRRHG
jgi:hypothetical protein